MFCVGYKLLYLMLFICLLVMHQICLNALRIYTLQLQHLHSSGRCQIIHWRQVHKLECQQLGNSCSSSSPKSAMSEEFTGKALLDETIDLKLFECRQQPMLENTSSDNVIKHRLSIPASTTTDLITNASVLPIINRRSVDRGTSLKSYNDVSREADGTILECHNPVSSNDVICSTLYNSPKKKASTRHEVLIL